MPTMSSTDLVHWRPRPEYQPLPAGHADISTG